MPSSRFTQEEQFLFLGLGTFQKLDTTHFIPMSLESLAKLKHVATFFYQQMPDSRTEQNMASNYMTYEVIWHLQMSIIKPNQAPSQHVGSHSVSITTFCLLKNTFFWDSLFYLFLMLAHIHKSAFENPSVKSTTSLE